MSHNVNTLIKNPWKTFLEQMAGVHEKFKFKSKFFLELCVCLCVCVSAWPALVNIMMLFFL